MTLLAPGERAPRRTADMEIRIRELLGAMTPEEKVGQLNLVPGAGGHVPDDLADAVRAGRVGSVLNEVDPGAVAELQRLAVEESRLGIPLLIGRDVIHGFRTVFPIPLALASSWDPELVRATCRHAAVEASARGVNWTFAPMVDMGRDPRWGRVAECPGEDPLLASVLAAAMVEGFQGDDLAAPDAIAACAKHFAGYGASESGKDYNTTNIPEIELRRVHLPPFEAAVRAGVASVMTSFSDLNGVPCTANEALLTGVLREEWGFDGLVVSDWDSIPQLEVHGLTGSRRHSAAESARAGVDVDMASRCYAEHLEGLVADGEVSAERLDAMVAAVLRVKLRLGLLDRPATEPVAAAGAEPDDGPDDPHDPTDDTVDPDGTAARGVELAREAALRSAVLLRNEGGALPLEPGRRVAVVGPLADEPAEQLGTWIFDGDPALSRTPLAELRERLGDDAVRYVRALETTRSRDEGGFAEAVEAVAEADVALLFLGEEAILSGEAHCRADIRLPGAQEALVRALQRTGTPLVLVLMAGRPIALEPVVDALDAILCAWHPGSMAGPALADLLLAVESPSGKLPVTFPRVTGQIPIHYAHKATGRPPTPESFTHIDAIPADADQVSVGNTSFHLDVWYEPLFPFGHGLAYTTFEYRDLRLDRELLRPGERLEVRVELTNTGPRPAVETVQLYLRDPVASATRPVRELIAFRRVPLEAGRTRTVSFELTDDDLAFVGREMTRVVEPGRFTLWVGGSSEADLEADFEYLDD